MSKIKDLRGIKFGFLTVMNEEPIRKNNNTYWKCKCICGNERYYIAGNLHSGASKSCGCQKNSRSNNRKKRYSQPPRLRRIFYGMKTRCYNSSAEQYKNYGARGIKICNEWLNNSKNFYEWAINNGYSDNLTIDRINVNGNYEPNNCRWVTMGMQQNNRRNSTRITINQKTKTASQWAREYGLTRDGFLYRYKHNLFQ